jgi:hypothetical protein
MALTLLAIATLVLSGKPMRFINPKTDYAFKKYSVLNKARIF